MNERDLIGMLQEGRLRERGQALFYRRLTGLAEDAGDTVAAERLNALLADEQHHLSRLTARILELGARPDDRDVPAVPESGLDGWESLAREREEDEVAWYERSVAGCTDEGTARVLDEILASERHHREELAGKWMPASSRSPERGGDGP